MKTLFTAAAIALAAPAALFAQTETTGVSTPPPAVIDATPDSTQITADAARNAAPTATYRPKPSAAVSYTSSPSSTTYGPYVPYTPGTAGPSAALRPFDPDAEIVTPASRMQNRISPLEDTGIVTHVPSRPNEVSEGTLLQARIRETLSTASTRVGTPFTAEVTQPMQHEGRVIVPVGSVIHGRVTVARGGRRIAGAAALHLLTESVTLPDGTSYILHAQVIDTSQHNVTRVDDEGTILRRDHVKGTVAAMSLTTGGAAAAGAMIGGLPGALVGGGIGAGVSTVWWLKQDRQEVIPQNTAIIFSLSVPMPVSPLAMGTR